MIRVLHAADLHLDSPFHALGREKALERRAEQRTLPRRIAAAAREYQADVALLAGDLFDSEDVFSDTARMLAAQLEAMEIPVFIAPGNHDRYTARSVWPRLALPDNVHVFTREEIECVPLRALGARVWGCAFTAPHRSPPLAGFEAVKDGDTIDLMVLHGEAGAPGSEYGAISPEEIARSGMDYIALGHIHKFSGLRRAGGTYYAWPGCPEGRGFDETGDKGVILADVGPDACELMLLPLGGRRYEILRVDLTGTSDVFAAVEAALAAESSRDIVRVVLCGETEEAPPLTALHAALRDRFYALELRDETRPRRQLWASRGSDDLRGIFLARLWRRLESAATEAERERVCQAARWGLLAMDHGEEPGMF